MIIGLVIPHNVNIKANKVKLLMFLDSTLSSIILSDESEKLWASATYANI